ncbi:MAG: hypothetical protein AB7O45_06525 [Alphaproteobacteria bacterium]
MLRRIAALAVASALLAPDAAAQGVTACPSEQVVRETIQKWITNYHKGSLFVASVGEFEFSPIRFGAIAKKQVLAGQEAIDTCPARLSYSYVATAKNGTRSTTRFGENHTFHFFTDNFGDWTYRHTRND